MWWLQEDVNAVEQIKMYPIEEEDGITCIPTVSEEMVNYHSFRSEILLEIMRSLETSKPIRFCFVSLKTTILIAENNFDRYVSDCLFDTSNQF